MLHARARAQTHTHTHTRTQHNNDSNNVVTDEGMEVQKQAEY